MFFKTAFSISKCYIYIFFFFLFEKMETVIKVCDTLVFMEYLSHFTELAHFKMLRGVKFIKILKTIKFIFQNQAERHRRRLPLLHKLFIASWTLRHFEVLKSEKRLVTLRHRPKAFSMDEMCFKKKLSFG